MRPSLDLALFRRQPLGPLCRDREAVRLDIQIGAMTTTARRTTTWSIRTPAGWTGSDVDDANRAPRSCTASTGAFRGLTRRASAEGDRQEQVAGDTPPRAPAGSALNRGQRLIGIRSGPHSPAGHPAMRLTQIVCPRDGANQIADALAIGAEVVVRGPLSRSAKPARDTAAVPPCAGRTHCHATHNRVVAYLVLTGSPASTATVRRRSDGTSAWQSSDCRSTREPAPPP